MPSGSSCATLFGAGDGLPRRPPRHRRRRPGPVDLLLARRIRVEPASVRHRLPAGIGQTGRHPLAADQLPQPAVGAAGGQRALHIDPNRTRRSGAGGRTPADRDRPARGGSLRPVPDRRPTRTTGSRGWSRTGGGGVRRRPPGIRRPLRSCCAGAATWRRWPRRCGPTVCRSRWSASAGCWMSRRSRTWSPPCACMVDPAAGAAAIRLLTGARWRLGDRRPGCAGRTRPGAGAVRAAAARVRRSGRSGRRAGGGVRGAVRRGHRRLVPDRCGRRPRAARRLLDRGLPAADQVRRPTAAAAGPDGAAAARPDRRSRTRDRTRHRGAARFAGRAAPTWTRSPTWWRRWRRPAPARQNCSDYLDAAAEREDGLTPGEVPSAAGRVQVLTVHAAKGLEWQIVAVPHLVDGVFPITRGSTWLGDAAQLPPQIRGDRDDLPQLNLPPDGNQKDWSTRWPRTRPSSRRCGWPRNAGCCTWR